MATYNREFLVPYLHDLCSLQFAKNGLEEHYSELCDEKEALEAEPCPPAFYSEEITTVTFGLGFGIAFGIAGVLGGMVMLTISDAFLSVMGVLCLLGYGALIFICSAAISENKKKLAANIAANQELREEMEELEKAHLEDLARIPEVEKQLEWCKSEIEKVDRLLKETYDVNIIPGKYRDEYAIVYLYDWFSTSRADDLDMALNTYVLEEIKDRLDDVINNQSAIILGQSIIAANQERQLETQEQQYASLKEKLHRMDMALEDQNVYLGMIESNTRATSFFAAADYFDLP